VIIQRDKGHHHIYQWNTGKGDSMDLKIDKLIRLSKFMPGWLQSRMILLDFDAVSYGKINLRSRTWFEISTKMDWLHQYYADGIDVHAAQRFKENLVFWHDLDRHHHNFLKMTAPQSRRFDLSIRYDHEIEYITLTYPHQFEIKQPTYFYKILHALSFEVNKKMRRERSRITLPYRIKNAAILQETMRDSGNKPDQKVDIQAQKKYAFNNVFLTALELKYVACLLSMMSFKEIAYHFSCSDTAVRKKVNTIKSKLGNENMSNSSLFKALKSQGVLIACIPDIV
tara:strand:+ start:16769 stop:17617 length:849 start_codon:yes stop_codon:yes gene_type:complete